MRAESQKPMVELSPQLVNEYDTETQEGLGQLEYGRDGQCSTREHAY